MTGRAPDKAEARDAAFARREAAHAVHSAAASAALVAEMAGVQGRVVAGYLPIRTEADPRPAMTALAMSNRVAVPVIEAPDRPLLFREWRPDAPLIEGPFKVMVPAEGAWLEPDLVIAPLLAFDDALYRLGYGGGFYDRTLARLRGRGPVEALGFAYDAQRAAALPLEPTDQPLDALVSETGRRAPL